MACELHPELLRRIELLTRLVRLEGGNVWVVSGCRSYNDQWVLYRRYGYPRAAHPDSYIGVDFLTGIKWTGSYHMAQAPDYVGHAVDLSWSEVNEYRLRDLAELCGLVAPFWNASVPEHWHYQWRMVDRVFPCLLDSLPEPDPLPGEIPLPPMEQDDDNMQLIQCDDGDVAVFLRFGNTKTWVRDPYAIEDARARGWVESNLDGTARIEYVGRNLLLSLATVGPSPQYPSDYDGPRTVV